jgi:hypothetical protein
VCVCVERDESKSTYFISLHGFCKLAGLFGLAIVKNLKRSEYRSILMHVIGKGMRFTPLIFCVIISAFYFPIIRFTNTPVAARCKT